MDKDFGDARKRGPKGQARRRESLRQKDKVYAFILMKACICAAKSLSVWVVAFLFSLALCMRNKYARRKDLNPHGRTS